MKLRLMVYVGMLAACGAVLGADVIVGKQTCAAMAVPATGTYTLIAVPFKDVGGADQKIKVADVVKTVGLKAGSHLFYYTGENYYAWKLEEGTWKGAAVSYKKNGKDEMTQTPEDGFQVPCGATLWLQRAEESEESVVLYGEEAPVPNPTLTAKSVQLISNPKATDYTFKAEGDEGVADGDMIMIPQDDGTQTAYTYKTGKGWGQYEQSGKVLGTEIPLMKFTVKTVTIPGGRGAWYVSKGTTPPSIVW
ncbi:MAG: hypothetical protein Q4G55_08740 [bacterium]|nr:hypothetical protein [bacterium]